jgi:hypothetical protein
MNGKRGWTGLGFVLGLLSLLAACEPEKPAEHPIVGMAQFDLQCPKEQLRYFHIAEGIWGVEGCGKRAKYVEICRYKDYDCHWVQN